MRSAFLFLLIVFGLPVFSQSEEKVQVKYEYLIYLPKKYSTSEKKYPLVIYLHGGSQTGNDLNKLKAYGPPKLVNEGQGFEFLIVSPQCPDGKYWSTDNWFDPLYLELVNKYRIDTNRIYLTGISMGGYGTWQTAVAHPDRFAAIAPLCGGCDDSTLICQIKDVPVWTFHGTSDNIIPIDETEKLVKRLDECNGNVKFTKLENEGHGIQYLYEKKDIYDWFLKHHK